MSHDLSLAQNHAFQLALTLMAPVTLFAVDGQFGVCQATSSTTPTWMSSTSSIPMKSGRLIEPACPFRGCHLRAGGGKGGFAAA
jgi:hypothetical protein